MHKGEIVDLFDTPAYKLARRNDPQTSKDAAKSIDANYMEQVVLDAIEMFGAAGCISDEVHRLKVQKSW